MRAQTSLFGITVLLLSIAAIFGSFGHALFNLQHHFANETKNFSLVIPLHGNGTLQSEVPGKFLYAYVFLCLSFVFSDRRFPLLAFVAFLLFWFLINNPDSYPPLLSLTDRPEATQRNITRVCRYCNDYLRLGPLADSCRISCSGCNSGSSLSCCSTSILWSSLLSMDAILMVWSLGFRRFCKALWPPLSSCSSAMSLCLKQRRVPPMQLDSKLVTPTCWLSSKFIPFY
jgi:hypothetical protein